MRLAILPILVAAFFCLAGQASLAQSQISIEEARLLAFKLVADGKFDSAAELAGTILEGDPQDQAALLALAQAEQGAGRTGSAVKAARAAWRASKTDPERYSSSIVAAQALAADGKRLRSQFWLRRATEHAPNDRFKARAARDFQFVKATTPLRAKLRFSISPSSNINNGSRNDTANFGGLEFLLNGDARALSGVEFRLGGDLSYVRLLTNRQNLTFGVRFDSSNYVLSSEAKRQAPNLSGSDLAFQELAFSLKSKRRDAQKPNFTEAGLSVGQNWYSGSSLTRFARLDIDRDIAVNTRARLGFGLSAERQWRRDNAARSSTIWRARAQYSRALKNGSGLTLHGQISDTNSASAIIAHQAVELGLTYRQAKPILGQTQLELSATIEERRYDRPSLFGFGARRDHRLTASATLILNDLEYFGFSPTATLKISQTDSNIPLNETENIGLNFGIRSSF